MGKFDLGGIVNEVQALYNKDKKSKSMISTGDKLRLAWTKEDGIPIEADSMIAELLGLPCIPDDKIIEFCGDPDTGKSTALMEAMAAAQRDGRIVVLWDAEDKFDANRFKTKFGGDPDDVLVIKTNEILQGGEKARKLIIAAATKYPKVKFLFLWDSVGGSQSRSHAERELDSKKHAQPGQDAKENGAVMRMLVALVNKYPGRIASVLANQVYTKMGFMQKGNKASGGKKVEFHCSAIVEMKQVKKLTEVVDGVKRKKGIITLAKVTKNHLSQGETSVDEMFFEITASGAKRSDFKGFVKKDDDEEEGEEE